MANAQRAVLALAAVIASLPQAGWAEVRVWQGSLTLPAYMEGAPDPNPPFDLFATSRFNYPYTLRENLTGQKADVAWRAVFLENEYLKCSVLPDLGGHLYTCVDKLSGQPMFYANPSIKLARIGYRGAWAAFGIEFNFPVSHNWVSMSPVDFTSAANADGSASVFVGNIDRPYGMQWTVELRLRPGSTVLEEHVTLYNRSDVRHRFYWWNNAAVRVWDDSKICYPMRWSASHGFTDVDTWPVDSSGTDLSVIKNQTRGTVSRFVHGSREPFMGIYHPHTDTGVVHYADYGDLPGKKIWSWGVDTDGLDWRRALSDDNSGYVEVQAGPMRNQETYAFLEPRQAIRFTEYWMPVRGTGGIARATLAGVLNLRREAGKLVVVFNANYKIAGARIRIRNGSARLYEATATLAPESVWAHEIAAAPSGPLTFELEDAGGRLLMRQTEGEYDWSAESEIRTGAQPRQPAGDALEIGTNQELNGDVLRAYETYTQALERSSGDLQLQVAAGRLATALLRYRDAVRWLEPAQARATQDAEIAYYLGLAYQGLGRTRDARIQFETAQRGPSFHVAGCLKLAELLAREGDREKALAYLDEIASLDRRAAEERIVLNRAMGRPAAGSEQPLSFFSTDGKDAERVLTIAAAYMRLGLWREAIGVLSREYAEPTREQTEPGIPVLQKHPVAAYYRAYCREKLGESGAADYAAAAKLSLDFVFPNGADTLQVLEAVLRTRPQDAGAHFLLGSLRMASGLVDDAVTEWTAASRLNPQIRVLHANLGRTLLYLKRDPQRALEAFRAGLGPDPKNDALYTGLVTAMGMVGTPAADAVAALERYPDPAQMPLPLVYDLMLHYAEAGQFDKARALFQGRYFAREEGGTNVRQIWIAVRALEARWNAGHGQCSSALAILDHLGEPSGQLAFTRDGLEPFIAAPGTQAALGSVEWQCGRQEAARERLNRLTGSSNPANIAFAYDLARTMGTAGTQDWKTRLESARQRADSGVRGGSWGSAVAGMLDLYLGQTEEARARLAAALLSADRNLAHHYSRELLRTGAR